MPKHKYLEDESLQAVSQSEQDPLLTIAEVARRLRVDATTVRRWISTGSLEAVALPHYGKRMIYRVRQSTLDKLLATPLVMNQE